MTSDPTATAAWDAEYRAGRYQDEPPVAFTGDILAAGRQAGTTSGTPPRPGQWSQWEAIWRMTCR